MTSSDRLDRLAEDLPATEEDVAVLRRLRRARTEGALRRPNRLNPPRLGRQRSKPRPTFEGCEELVL